MGTMGKLRPSSQLVEFIIAIAVGLLAILGGLLCVGFLLIDPVRNPNGIGESQPLPDNEDSNGSGGESQPMPDYEGMCVCACISVHKSLFKYTYHSECYKQYTVTVAS